MTCYICGRQAEFADHGTGPMSGGATTLVLWNAEIGDNEVVCFSCAASNPKDLYRCCAKILRRALEG